MRSVKPIRNYFMLPSVVLVSVLFAEPEGILVHASSKPLSIHSTQIENFVKLLLDCVSLPLILEADAFQQRQFKRIACFKILQSFSGMLAYPDLDRVHLSLALNKVNKHSVFPYRAKPFNL
jgi:hypothetical protein